MRGADLMAAASPVGRPRPPACLIDASIYIFRYYFSLPDNWFSEAEGYPTAAVYGYTTFLLQLLQRHRPEIIAACFDESLGSCFRNEIYPDYKASRALPDAALAYQLDACREVTQLLGIAAFASDTYEADDLIGTLARRLRRRRAPVAILSRDKDLGQLLRREVDFLWDYAKDERWYRADITAKFGVEPEQLVDYLALVGDSIDDIPGVPGIGAKTARALLQACGNIDAVFKRHLELRELPIRGAGTLAAKLAQHREQIEMARQLATIVDAVPMTTDPAALAWREPDLAALEAFYRRMGFGDRLMRKTAALIA
ncbi:flap endonuclease [Exilibacterium tricleocarpae]|uniref:Flap endonuclease n=1 Tax=Exilibacterium tricleocarpae TaxID=2591008 RepID=A0A545SS41_9GAMM|nr:5'-3' exonuclease H3TH domain-containing protein [Exilibacterium tricleocarpae]TQV67783.1 flap endonuclease [Exilibacterium tricleocarpae]